MERHTPQRVAALPWRAAFAWVRREEHGVVLSGQGAECISPREGHRPGVCAVQARRPGAAAHLSSAGAVAVVPSAPVKRWGGRDAAANRLRRRSGKPSAVQRRLGRFRPGHPLSAVDLGRTHVQGPQPLLTSLGGQRHVTTIREAGLSLVEQRACDLKRRLGAKAQVGRRDQAGQGHHRLVLASRPGACPAWHPRGPACQPASGSGINAWSGCARRPRTSPPPWGRPQSR